MSRARNIKPGFFKNEELADCDPMARLLFIGLWTLADRNGNLEHRPKRVKGEVFPYDNCDIQALLDQLAAKELVSSYSVDGRDYLHIPTFTAHQRPHPGEKPIHPEPSAVKKHDEKLSNQALTLIPSSLNPSNPMPAVEKPRQADPLFESLAQACGIDWRQGLGKAARGGLNAALADLREMGATPDEVPRRAVAYRKRFGADISLTPAALAKHWPSLGETVKPTQASTLSDADRARVEATNKAMADRAARLASEAGAVDPSATVAKLKALGVVR